uniref:Uncharacterized protein n=1 Tax=Kalanchoe fedtschenkoi TaxID=63787 RepID=A0A7N0U6G4_KALFE
MENVSESDKRGVIIFGQQFCDKLEHIPIKKRILLRDSAIYQRTPSSVEVSDHKVISSSLGQETDLVASPSLAQDSNPNFFSEQQPDNLKSGSGLVDDNRSEVLVLNNEKADCPPDFSGIETPVDSTCSSSINTVDNANKVPSIESLSPCTESKLSVVPSFASAAEDDILGTKSTEKVKSLAGDITGDSYSSEKTTIQPDPPCMDQIAVQPVTQDVRILWDLNVEMDAWEKPDDHHKIESQSDVASSECMRNTKLDIPEDQNLKEQTLMSEHDTENNMPATLKSTDSGGICKHEHMISDSKDFMDCESIRQDQQVATGICPKKPFSALEPSLEIESMNTSCNQNLGFRTDDHLTATFRESTSKLADTPRIEQGSSDGTTNYRAKSTEDQNCESKKIVLSGGSSGNNLQTCNDGNNGSSKKRANAKHGQHEVIDLNSSNQYLDLFGKRAYVVEGNEVVSLTEKTIAETVEAAPTMHHPSEELTENSYHVGISVETQLPVSFQEGCAASVVEPACVPGKCNQDASVFKQVPNIDVDRGAQTEQDYEDGELRDLDSHYWNEIETEMGETECLDYEPAADSDVSPASAYVAGKVECGLTSKKRRSSETLVKDQLVRKDHANSDEKVISGLSSEEHNGTHNLNAQLEKKLSGWDQLPKDGQPLIDKVQDTHGISSRTSRSELQSCIEIPTLSEDAEEKETVVERRIRPKDMDDSYPAESGSGFGKFSGKRRFALNIPGRNRVDDWDSERRSSVNYHDIYDNHSGSRHMIMNAKGREHHRSRSPSERSEAYDAPINYSRYSRGRYGRHAEGCRRFVADDRGDSEFCGRQQFIRRDKSFSPRTAPHFSETFNRSRSRSRTRSPPMWLPSYEQVGSRGHHRSPDFGAEDRVKRTRLPLWKSSFASDNDMRYTSPPRGGFMPQNKPRWNDNEDFDMGGPRDRSPARSFRHKEKFGAACSRGRFKSSEDFRPMGYRARMREIASPERFRGYVSGNDRRKREGSFETVPRKRFYKDGFTRQYRHDTGDDIAPQNCPLKEDFLEDGENRIASIRKKDSSHERYEYDQLSYPGSTPKAKR